MFTETDSNGNRFNALELLFNAEMTPPMVSPPLDRPSNLIDLYKIEPSNPNQGGYLHPQMQRKYPVISTIETRTNTISFVLSPLKMRLMH